MFVLSLCFFNFSLKKADVSDEDFLRLNTFPHGLDVTNQGSMSRRSIFSRDDPEIAVLQKALADGSLSVKEQRGLGVLFGMVCGDAVGAPLEFSSVRYGVQDFDPESAVEALPTQLWAAQTYNRFRLKPGQWTDDASMGLCLAVSTSDDCCVSLILASKKGLFVGSSWSFGPTGSATALSQLVKKGS